MNKKLTSGGRKTSSCEATDRALRRELTIQRPDPEDRKKSPVRPNIGPVLLLCESVLILDVLYTGACAAPGWVLSPRICADLGRDLSTGACATT